MKHAVDVEGVSGGDNKVCSEGTGNIIAALWQEAIGQSERKGKPMRVVGHEREGNYKAWQGVDSTKTSKETPSLVAGKEI